MKGVSDECTFIKKGRVQYKQYSFILSWLLLLTISIRNMFMVTMHKYYMSF